MYKIKLDNFEGPLDLLLFFVRRDELNIYDIPIAHITKSYLEYLQLMKELNLDVAGEFILMAATLMRIKAKSLLPRDDEESEDELDASAELSRRLIEYRQFKEASKSLRDLSEYWSSVYRRSYFNFDLLPKNISDEESYLKDISFFDLLAAYKNALSKKPIEVTHDIERPTVTVEDQQTYIRSFFRGKSSYLFSNLCEELTRIEIVVTFLALLELIKQQTVGVKQTEVFDDILVFQRDESGDTNMRESQLTDESGGSLTTQE